MIFNCVGKDSNWFTKDDTFWSLLHKVNAKLTECFLDSTEHGYVLTREDELSWFC